MQRTLAVLLSTGLALAPFGASYAQIRSLPRLGSAIRR